MERKPNRLIHEKSPYLRQHAFNPVDWYPWCEEAFEKAKREDKPIFLSIGYSTCHWCHVMERESFEDEEIAKILNENFVSIKVDREERPDVDALYMSVCQMMTGSGGWPLTIVMTPEKEPFFAGTYFPKESLYGRAGLRDILLRIAQLWKEDRDRILESAKQIVKAVKSQEEESYSGAQLNETIIHRAYGNLLASYDEEFGGFGSAPKFPVPHNLMFLLRYWRRYGKERALEMVLKTLTSMRLGGIWDHVGFGFHRYSTDREWHLPHFEKMLYDNALLMIAYSEGYQASGDDFFRRTVEEIAEYLLRDMRSQEGAFFSAEDADSEGEEGKFYLWGIDELKEVLTKEELEIATVVFSLAEEGNFLEEATKRRTGRNILRMRKRPEEYARDLGMEEEVIRQRLEEIRVKLFKAREKRVRPLKDEKILTDWNSLAIVGFVRAGLALGREDYIEVAQGCADFLLDRIITQEGEVLHRYKDGEAGIGGFLEDYAYLLWALTELYMATFEERYLETAERLLEKTLSLFRDPGTGAFYQTRDTDGELFARKREIYDGALPSGNSVMAFNLERLSRILERSELGEMAHQTLLAFSEILNAYPSAHTFSMIALDLLINGGFELKVRGNPQKAREEVSLIQREFLPEGVFVHTGDDSGDGVSYMLCRNRTCEVPQDDIEGIRKRLQVGVSISEG